MVNGIETKKGIPVVNGRYIHKFIIQANGCPVQSTTHWEVFECSDFQDPEPTPRADLGPIVGDRGRAFSTLRGLYPGCRIAEYV